jgi:tetratricopeptide (TPR) repeat protein
MIRRPPLLRTPLAALFASAVLSATSSAQTVQYRSPAGIEYRSLPDTGPVARAARALAADPRNLDRIIALGTAQAGARQMREAVETFTRGLAAHPDHALLLRWRGHRYLSLREFDKAMADLDRAASLDSTIYGVWYHRGILRFARADFDGAAADFARALPLAPDPGELAGSTDWRWMSLARAGRAAEARAFLARRTDSLPTNVAYATRLRLYRGEIAADAVLTPADTADVQLATLAYGLGNWFLTRGDSAAARLWFQRAVQSGGWPAFGFILAEVELRRM